MVRTQRPNLSFVHLASSTACMRNTIRLIPADTIRHHTADTTQFNLERRGRRKKGGKKRIISPLIHLRFPPLAHTHARARTRGWPPYTHVELKYEQIGLAAQSCAGLAHSLWLGGEQGAARAQTPAEPRHAYPGVLHLPASANTRTSQSQI